MFHRIRLLLIIVSLLQLSLFALNSPAFGSIGLPFYDINNYWPSWNNDTTADNNSDVIGEPDINPNADHGVISYDDVNGLLESIQIQYTVHTTYNHILLPGDLFIDFRSSSSESPAWDLVIHSPYAAGSDYPYSNLNDDTARLGNNPQSWDLYDLSSSPIAVEQAQAGNAYLLSDSSHQRNGNDWSGFNIRNGHPWALNTTLVSTGNTGSTVNFSGWLYDIASPFDSTFWVNWDFTSLGGGGYQIPANTKFILVGFAPNCANDVIFEEVELLQPIPQKNVPEPVSFIVWGFLGIICIGTTCWSHRKK